MPKVSSRQDKTMYMTVREELGLTRERASELIQDHDEYGSTAPGSSG